MSAWNISWFSISQDLDNYLIYLSVCLPSPISLFSLSLSLSLSLSHWFTKNKTTNHAIDRRLIVHWLLIHRWRFLPIYYLPQILSLSSPLRIYPSNEPLDWGFPCGQQSLPDVGEGCGFDRIHLECVEQGDYVRGLTGVLTAILASVGLRPGIGYLCSVRAEGPRGKTISICIRCT